MSERTYNAGGGKSRAAERAAARAFSTIDRDSSRRASHRSERSERSRGKTYSEKFAESDRVESSRVNEQWKKAATHILIASGATLLVAATILYVSKSPLVLEPKEHRFDEEKVSLKRLGAWSAVSALVVAVAASVYVYSRYKKETSSLSS